MTVLIHLPEHLGNELAGPPFGRSKVPADRLPWHGNPRKLLHQTDELQLADPESCKAHGYDREGMGWFLAFKGFYEGERDGVEVRDFGPYRGNLCRKERPVRFKLKIEPENAGVLVRRRMNQAVAGQGGLVFVDGKYVGVWYHANVNIFKRLHDSEFFVPPQFTRGKTRIAIEIKPPQDIGDEPWLWSEFRYWALTLGLLR